MKKVRITSGLTIGLLSLAMTACSGGSDSPAAVTPPSPPVTTPPVVTPPTPAQILSGMEDKGELPKLERSATVAGPDSNANGVRDDIEAIVTARFTEAGQRSAAMQSAKAYQSSLTVDTANKAATLAVSQSMMNATNCLYEKFPIGQNAPAPGVTTAGALTRELEAMTANTKPRLQAYLKFNRALDGTVSSVPKGSTCE